ncbi:homoserine O-acetyltransferase family protein [Deinococcus radiodurans]|uniref:Homoserine O-acetyltransferase n=1 Tax=Deinococcus radiodurans (strain ATCC 13939 / DSM 20539 / JCM 16871 / CCUG 27074 / LMG 4051 / NBRC 15346 / NCIMB 9279 / VKM B-1422 / R1) TaxID=243230 RepID=METXA_DEIRA|nr:alpha/beta fold hydrolase family protein [Deinococcus radiodurans]Q9RVZ8.1 RecName: Full=Homoserine O-acetyltransferase; Short=HAT; AltName: Full=Homoserine transacetylase; Short=HTA [Deinococcus radiodurans R1 = ATCC 13939 = DSM 20539]AAF10449.1 homoserine O-acetyltransferase, putative [Deinococcus radiodurans R1 = ATCC 13939 = DSM 20539]ANC71922.1 homoserine acetyltransferase [Deinococcus radiodurans R1 = ATCC 13939 = DSM 20539]QEM70379.1 alpha/beta fold hydrolase [Deinococcus radiodurans]
MTAVLAGHASALLLTEEPDCSGPQTVVLFRREPLLLDCGRALSDVRVAFHTYGTPRADATLVLHALTGDSAVHEWWPDFLGAGRPLDPADDYVVCANVLGGCAGTTSAAELAATCSGPVPLSLRDMARVGRALLDSLGVRRVRVIGASMGGMLAYAWLLECPDLVEKAVIIGAPARHSPWAIGLNTAARSAIALAPGGEGLKVARQIAMLSYRSPESLSRTQAGQRVPGVPAVTSYLHYQGEKLAARFDEQTYCALTWAMDAFQPSSADLKAVRAPVLVVGISSDLLYPAAEVRACAAELPHADYWELGSIHGHDAFLMDPQDLPERVGAFLRS